MAASYPASNFSWTDRVDGVDDVMAADPNVLAAEIDAISDDMIGAGTAGGLKTAAFASFSARYAIEVSQNGLQVINLKLAKNGAGANKLDIFAKSTGLAPAAASPIKVMIPDGTGCTLRTRAAAVVSGTSQIVLADAAGYWGYGTLNASSYIAYLYAIYSAADAGIVWAVSANPNLRMVATTATATDFSYMLLEGSSTYSRQATDYCVRVGAFKFEYDTGDTPDYTIDAANIYVGYERTPIDNDWAEYPCVISGDGGGTAPTYTANFVNRFRVVGKKVEVAAYWYNASGGTAGSGANNLLATSPIAPSATAFPITNGISIGAGHLYEAGGTIVNIILQTSSATQFRLNNAGTIIVVNDQSSTVRTMGFTGTYEID